MFHLQTRSRSNRNITVLKCNSSARAIRNLALQASKLAHASGLLIIGRLAHNQPDVLIHASMIRSSNWLWLNCYNKNRPTYNYSLHCTRFGRNEDTLPSCGLRLRYSGFGFLTEDKLGVYYLPAPLVNLLIDAVCAEKSRLDIILQFAL